MNKWLAWVAAVGMATIGTVGVLTVLAFADSQSAHYQLRESLVGGGGLIQSTSPSYQSREAIGDTAVGNTASTNYQTNTGYVTTGDPALSVGLNNANATFTDFSPGTAATATASFEVADYTSYGYAVQIVGNPPSNGSHTITAMATTGASQPGSEQFGINLVANTSPIAFGANPNHGQFGVGSASPNYGTANQFRYVSGETIATAPKSSGDTIYTISYIVNVTSLTPGGQYSGNQSIICTGTY